MRTRRGWRAPALFAGFDRPVGRRRSPVGRGAGIEVLEDRTLLAGNPIVDENLLPGNPRSEWDVTAAGDTSLQGFSTDISVDQGRTIRFKINDASLAAYHIDIYRMGYYGGLGARKVATIPSSATQRTVQPAGLRNTTTGLLDCGNWSESASWAVPTTAVSGVYIAKLVREDNGGASHIPFVVRDDDGQSDLLYQTSDSTWQAYNNYGGNSLYEGSSAYGTRAVKVSYNRPWNTRAVVGGAGASNWFFWAEYPMIRWLEQNGYNVSYFTNVDSERLGPEILEHKAFLSVGHDEYWSNGQRLNVEAARDAGVNLAFFSGNEVFWKTRWENSIDASGTPYRTLVCYKETHAGAKIDPLTNVWTGTWRDPRFSPPADGGRPENSLTGTIFTVNRGLGGDFGTAIKVPEAEGKMRLWRNTSVATLGAGQTATLANGTLGYEWDEDLDNGFRPAGLIRLSSTVENVPERIQDNGSTYGPGTATHSLTLYRAASGALVFGAGTVQWSFGLDATHDGPTTVPDVRMRQATVNLFADMNVQPGSLASGLTLASASTDALRPTSVITSPMAGAVLQVGVPVTINGTANDTGGGVVAAVEVSTDGGLTWHRATGRTSWSYTWTPSASGAVTLRSRAVDDSVNLQSPTTGTTVNVSAANTLVAAYGFDAGGGATAVDSSGRGNNGAITGATWTTGRFGGALAFNGSNQWVTVADASSLDLTTGMTLEAWVRPNALNSWTSVLMKENGAGLSYSLYANQDVARPASFINVGSGDQSVGGTAAIPLNAWSHLAATYDGASLRLYVNGNLVNTAAVSGPIVVSTGALRIGGNAVWGEYFSGLIDEVRLYSRALAQSDIQVDMNTPIGVDNTPPTVGTVSPVNNATGVDAAANVTAQFSEALDPATVAAATFELRGPSGALVSAAVSYNSATRTATLDPTASLALATTYTARVRGGSTGVKDLAGNPLAADFTWTFTTVAAPLPTLAVSDVSVTEGNSGTVDAVFNVTLSAASAQTVTVTYATANGTATAGSDYAALSSTTLTFAPGETSKPVVVTVNGDATAEGNETFFLNLSTPTNATLGDAQGQGTIVNDDAPPPTLSVSDVSVTEGNSGTVDAVFNVTLSAASAQTVTVTYATANGTATVGSDYNALASTTLTFAPGETSKPVVVTVLGDTTAEGNETFVLNLSAPTNATLADAQGQGTIVNDDAPPPTLSVSDVSVTEGNSGTVDAVFNVTLSAASAQTVTVTYATANGTATAGSDYTALSSATLTFAPGETSKPVVVAVNGDVTAEGNETFVLNLSAPTNATLGDAQGQGTIVNDDSPPPSTGLVAAYGFNEGTGGTVADASGNGLNGTLANTTWSTAGRFGNALSFNGANALVTVNDANVLDLTVGMTLEAWVNPASMSDWRSVVVKERASGLSYALYGSDGTNRPPSGYIAQGGVESGVVGTSVVPLNTWTHLATSYDGSALRLYVNGTLVQTRALSGNIAASNRALRIGGNAVWGEYFSGLIDEVRVYNRALSQTEIQTDMNTPVGGGPAALDADRPAGTGTGAGTPAGDSVLTASALDPLVAEAAARWRAAAPAGTDLSPLAAPSIQVVDLPGTQLGWTADGTIWLDRDAAGFGWFLDPTPGDDREFTRHGNQGERGRIDLLSALAHEMGHLLGFSHDDAGVMAATLSPGVRTVSGAFAAQDDGTAAADQSERDGGDWIAPGVDEESLADLAAELIRSRTKRGRLVADRTASLVRPGAAT